MRLTANEAHSVRGHPGRNQRRFFFDWNVRDLKRVCVYIIIYSLQLQSLTQLEMKKRESRKEIGRC